MLPVCNFKICGLTRIRNRFIRFKVMKRIRVTARFIVSHRIKKVIDVNNCVRSASKLSHEIGGAQIWFGGG